MVQYVGQVSSKNTSTAAGRAPQRRTKLFNGSAVPSWYHDIIYETHACAKGKIEKTIGSFKGGGTGP